MTSKEHELLQSYLYSYAVRLDRERDELQQRLRYRKFNSVDVIEMLILQQRCEDFAEFSRDISHLLHLGQK